MQEGKTQRLERARVSCHLHIGRSGSGLSIGTDGSGTPRTLSGMESLDNWPKEWGQSIGPPRVLWGKGRKVVAVTCYDGVPEPCIRTACEVARGRDTSKRIGSGTGATKTSSCDSIETTVILLPVSESGEPLGGLLALGYSPGDPSVTARVASRRYSVTGSSAC